MTQTIQSNSGKWTFEIHDKKTIKQTSPTIILLAKEFSQEHNAKFPYKIEAIYYVENPETFINRPPQFILNIGEKLLVLQHDYADPKGQSMIAIQSMKEEFLTEAFHEATKL